MKFNVWEKKLKERLDVWYLAKQEEELQTVRILYHLLNVINAFVVIKFLESNYLPI